MTGKIISIPANQASAESHLAQLRILVERNATDAVPGPGVRDKAALLLLDTIGSLFAGRMAPEMQSFENALAGIESGPFRFPGGAGLSTQAAAAISAMASTWDEGCEGLAYAHGRPGLSIVGALLPLAVVRRASLEEVLRSLIAGYEVGARMGGWLRIRPGMHVDGNWPGLGVAAAVSRLLRLSASQTMTAINTAACQLPNSLYLPIRTGDNARNTYIAHSAWLGLVAAFSAAAGITAPTEALSQYAAEYAASSAATIPAPDASHAFVLDAYLKPHASARHAHYGVEAATRIRAELGGNTASITAIRLRAYEEAVAYAGNRSPRAPITAQFSVSFGVAAGLRYGAMEPEIYRAQNFRDPELRRLEELVEVQGDPALGAGGRRSAVLTVEANDRILEARADTIPGDPELQLSREQVVAKFMRYVDGALEHDKAARFANEMTGAESSTDFGAMWERLC